MDEVGLRIQSNPPSELRLDVARARGRRPHRPGALQVADQDRARELKELHRRRGPGMK